MEIQQIQVDIQQPHDNRGNQTEHDTTSMTDILSVIVAILSDGCLELKTTVNSAKYANATPRKH